MGTGRRRAEFQPTGPIDRRVERFVERYLDSPLKLDLLRCLGQRPNRVYSFPELGDLVGTDAAEVERAVFYFERLGIVARKPERYGDLVSLSKSPVVRESAMSTFRFTTRPGGYAHLTGLISRKSKGSAGGSGARAPEL